MIDRRNFCKKALLAACGVMIPLSALELFDPKRLIAEMEGGKKLRWGFLVDTRKCVGCGFCVKACKLENEVPYDANVTRTWVERYILTRDGNTYIDSPKGARDGFTSKEVSLGADGMKEIRDEEIAKAFFVPKLCIRCHAKLDTPSSGRAKIRGIDPETHNPEAECSLCHDPHHPNLEELKRHE